MVVLILFLRTAIIFAACYFSIMFIENFVDRNSKFYGFYHKKIKRPFQRASLRLKRSQREDQLFTELSMTRNQDLIDFHMVDMPTRRPDSYNPLEEFTPEKKIKFCRNEIRKLRDEVLHYLNFTGGRVKPNDVYRLEILKREMNQLIGNGNERTKPMA
jgi:hypothetical protein